MIFEQVQDALRDLLGAQAAGRYVVEGYRRQTVGTTEVRHVAVFYRQGQFDKTRSGWLQGPFRHAMTYGVELLVSAPARVDLAVLNDPGASAQALMSALAASQEAAAEADRLWNELAGILWSILLDPRNATLGDRVTDRWIAGIQKENVAPRGELVLLAGSMDYSCSAVETAPGEVGVQSKSVDVALETAPPGGAPIPALAGAETDPSEV